MRIIEFRNENNVIAYLESCSWSAGKFLYKLIVENKVEEILGCNSKIIVLLDDDNVVSFATYAKRDCIEDDSLFPWIGFVYTDEKYRGKRYSQKLINYIIDKARKDGHYKIYLATTHKDLYEKYGFKYLEDRLDIYNEIDRVYYYDLLEKYYKMLNNYYDDSGLLKQYPSKNPLREIVLKRIGEEFEYNKDYKEKDVNEIIRKNICFNDVEMIRRELYNHHILNRLRDGSKYWKE